MICEKVLILCSGEYVVSELTKVAVCFQSEAGLSEVTPPDVDDCSGCKVVIDALDNRMQTMSRDELLNNFLQVGKWVCHWPQDVIFFLLPTISVLTNRL